mmetsp:Transcript_36621/g.96917  ORF Transcript_36621/g.96917 Transcript_36621/m.96917 type:complete len:253 (-) Transcript_36621:2-760(-)
MRVCRVALPAGSGGRRVRVGHPHLPRHAPLHGSVVARLAHACRAQMGRSTCAHARYGAKQEQKAGSRSRSRCRSARAQVGGGAVGAPGAAVAPQGVSARRGADIRERSVICASMSQASARRRSCRAGAAPRPRAAKGPAAPAGAAWLIGLRDWDVRRGRTCPRDEMRRGAGGGASVALRSPALGLNQSSNGGLSSSCSSSLSSYQDGIRCGMTNTSARQSGGAIPSASITNSSNRGCISSSPSSSSTPSKPM